MQVTFIDKSIMLLFVFLIMFVGVANAEVILLNDTFDIPAIGAVRADDIQDPNDIAWYALDDAFFLDVGYDFVFTSSTLAIQGGGPNAAGNIPRRIGLVNVGDYIALSFDFRLDRGYTEPNYAFGFGLYDSGSTFIDGDLQVEKIADDKGYYAKILVANKFTELSQEVPVGDMFVTEPSQTLNSVTISPNIADTTIHSAELIITRIASGVSLTLKMDGTVVLTGNDTTSQAIYELNEIAIINYVIGDTFIDNVMVKASTLLPPASCAEAIFQGYKLTADIDKNCKVNFADLDIIVDQWLDCIDPEIGGCSTPWVP